MHIIHTHMHASMDMENAPLVPCTSVDLDDIGQPKRFHSVCCHSWSSQMGWFMTSDHDMALKRSESVVPQNPMVQRSWIWGKNLKKISYSTQIPPNLVSSFSRQECQIWDLGIYPSSRTTPYSNPYESPWLLDPVLESHIIITWKSVIKLIIPYKYVWCIDHLQSPCLVATGFILLDPMSSWMNFMLNGRRKFFDAGPSLVPPNSAGIQALRVHPSPTRLRGRSWEAGVSRENPRGFVLNHQFKGKSWKVKEKLVELVIWGSEPWGYWR